jgi:uncharacterized protein YlxP (DUF503 family)
MHDMHIGLCVADIYLPGIANLKSKRRAIKSIKNKLHQQFNLSVAETGCQDKWQRSRISFVCVSNDKRHADAILSKALDYLSSRFMSYEIISHDKLFF